MLNYIYDLATDKKRGLIHRPVKSLLYFLSLIYGLSVKILIALGRLKAVRPDCKVISVGNLTLGGTGKTSLVRKIALDLKEKGRRVAVLSRGYARNSKSKFQNSKVSYEAMGDEAYMLSRSLKTVPVIVDHNRARAAGRAIKEHGADTVILDDGLQQWKLTKDLEIIAIDATNPFGNQCLIPRGILREPLASLKRAGVFVLTKTNLNPDVGDLESFLSRINKNALIVEAAHQPLGFYRIEDKTESLVTAGAFKEKRVNLFCGIGDPDSFENLILSLGIKVGLCFAFPDHHDYRESDLRKIIADSKAMGIETLITTEKDAARIGADSRFEGLACYVLRIKLEIAQNEAFLKRIYSLF